VLRLDRNANGTAAATHAFKPCHTSACGAWKPRQHGCPARHPWRIAQDGCDGCGVVGDVDQVIVSLDAVTTDRGLRNG